MQKNGEKQKKIPLSSIRPNPDNPRVVRDAKFKKLCQSIREFPDMMFKRPIVTAGGVVLGGNMRLEALKKLGYTEIPAGWVVSADDWTEEQRRRFVIADNVQFGEWDMDKLANEWDTEKLIDWGLSESDMGGFGLGNDVEEGNFDAKPPKEPVCKTGDLWIMGEHRLLCGDSTNVNHIEKVINKNHIDRIVFDPPYDIESFYDIIPIAKQNQGILIFWDFKRFGIASHKAIIAKWTPQYEFIWDCCQSWYIPNRPLARHKACGYFSDCPDFNLDEAVIKDGIDRGNRRIVKNTRGFSDYTPLDNAVHIRTVESFPNTKQSDEHCHGKPIEWIKAIFAGIGGNVFVDYFSGGGTSFIACEMLGKKCYGIEISPAYCDVILNRWAKLTGKTPVHENGTEWVPNYE